MNSQELLDKCVSWAKEKKAQDIMSMDLRGISLIADYFLLATAGNTRQAQAIADYLKEEAETLANPPLRMEGYNQGRWILLDFGSVIVHIFMAEERQYYNLERLWGDAPRQNY